MTDELPTDEAAVDQTTNDGDDRGLLKNPVIIAALIGGIFLVANSLINGIFKSDTQRIPVIEVKPSGEIQSDQSSLNGISVAEVRNDNPRQCTLEVVETGTTVSLPPGGSGHLVFNVPADDIPEVTLRCLERPEFELELPIEPPAHTPSVNEGRPPTTTPPAEPDRPTAGVVPEPTDVTSMPTADPTSVPQGASSTPVVPTVTPTTAPPIGGPSRDTEVPPTEPGSPPGPPTLVHGPSPTP